MSGRFPENRFTALDEFLSVLGFRRCEWTSLFKVLSKANCGFFEFILGNLTIHVNVGSEPDLVNEEGDKWVRISFESVKGNVEKSAVYHFGLMELEALSRRKQLKIKSFEDR